MAETMDRLINAGLIEIRKPCLECFVCAGRVTLESGESPECQGAPIIDVGRLMEQLAAMLDTLGKVRDLHGKPRTERYGSGCVQCGILWPCPTYRLVTAALDGVQAPEARNPAESPSGDLPGSLHSPTGPRNDSLPEAHHG